MSQTLKERHEKRQRLNVLIEKTIKIDKKLSTLSEGKGTKTLLEAVDEAELRRAAQVLDQLEKLKTSNLNNLNNAIEQASSDVNKFVGGDQGLLKKGINWFKKQLGLKDPIHKTLGFVNAIKNASNQLPTIVKNNLGTVRSDNAEKTLSDICPPEKRQTLEKTLLKSLTPTGTYAKLMGLPYGKAADIVQDIMGAKISELSTVMKQINALPVPPPAEFTAAQQSAFDKSLAGKKKEDTKAPEEKSKVRSADELLKNAGINQDIVQRFGEENVKKATEALKNDKIDVNDDTISAWIVLMKNKQ